MDEEDTENDQQLNGKCEEYEHKRNLMKYDIAKIIGDGPEGDKSESVVEKKLRKHIHTLNIFWEMCSGIRESVNLIALTYEGVQLQVNNDKNMF